MAFILSRRLRREGKRNGAPLWHGLDLSTALRILRHAGRPDPTQTGGFRLKEQLQRLIDSLCELSVNDGLTGLVNATFFHLALSSEVDRSYRTGRSCGLFLLDLDHFKNVNDTYGHSAGDCVLQALSQRIRTSLRAMDTAARIGGEEFAVILPECSAEAAVRAATRVYSALNPLSVNFGNRTLVVTMSAGLVWTDVRSPVGSETLLAMADEELYRAKRSGRNRMCHAPVETTEVTADEKDLLMTLLPGGDDGP
jgi:diguanylate cyclase (GGDEF)-like protein